MRAEKVSMLNEVRTKLSGTKFFFLANYQGMSVGKTDDLRRRLRAQKASMQVVQNKHFLMAVRDLGYPEIDTRALRGPSAMIFGQGDVVAVAKVLKDFIRENEKPVVKVGGLQGRWLSREDVDSLAALPSREVLLGQVVGTIAAPMSRLVGALQQKVASVLYVLKAYADKKGQTSQSA
ncbi:MAG: 50S ribosomal protein L10 [Kiritimatiellae bacterium]|nr:50S ribosomal protein L10 [Kiritimatiellia bacterium]MDW8457520.1 50S ribosomal protein L10 [Verrucomicrobiota bacterium]